MSHRGEIRSRRLFDACGLWKAHLLLGPRTAPSVQETQRRLGVLDQSHHLSGEVIRGIVSAEDWRSTKMA